MLAKLNPLWSETELRLGGTKKKTLKRFCKLNYF